MKRRSFIISSVLLVLVAVSVIAVPGKGKSRLNRELPKISLTSEQAGKYVSDHEAAIPNIKPENASTVVYANETTKSQTGYCLLYLHGFSASPMEGNPSHINIGKAFGMNTYLPRLAAHGLITEDALIDMTPENLWNSAKEALVIAKALGKKVILMGTSTGGTLALKLAADFPEDIAAVLLYSPNVKIANKAASLLAGPFGLQLGRMISHGKYRVLESDPKTDPYWYNKYRVEGVVYLQKLLNKTMKASVFAEVKQPVFVGYYYKDEEHQDPTVSVKAILWMYDKLGTSPEMKVKTAFPDAGDHVIGCDLTNPNWIKVYNQTSDFLVSKMGMTVVAK